MYQRICIGKAVLPKEMLNQLVRRKAPLHQFEELLKCSDGLFHSFFVWTGTSRRCCHLSSIADEQALRDSHVPPVVIAGAQGIGKTTVAMMACSEVTEARP